MEPLIDEAVNALIHAYQNGGWLAGLGTLAMFSIRLYRIPKLQDALPIAAQWKRWPRWLRMVAPFAAGGIGALLLGLAGGTTGSALISVVISGLIAQFMHKGTDKVGRFEASVREPGKKYSIPRRMASIAVPIKYPDMSK